MLKFWCPRVALSYDSRILNMVVIHSPIHLTYSKCSFMYQSAGKLARYRLCQNLYLVLEPSHGACKGKSTPEIPSTTNTRISQRGTSLRILFWLGREIRAWGGGGGDTIVFFLPCQLTSCWVLCRMELHSGGGGGSQIESLWSSLIVILPEGCHATDWRTGSRE